MDRSKRYHTLQQARMKLVGEGDELGALEDPTDEQIKRLQEVSAEVEKIDLELAVHKKWAEIDRAAPGAAPVKTGRDLATVRDLSEDDPKRGFRNMADFALSVKGACKPNGRQDPRLAPLESPELLAAAPTGYYEHGDDSGEGYLVPPAMRNEIWQLIFAAEGILEFLGPQPTSSNAVSLVKDETTPWGSSGIQAAWLDAGEQLTPTKANKKRVLNELFRLGAFVLEDDQLADDHPRLANNLTVGAAGAINWKAEEACIFGDGVGKPLGFAKTGGNPLVVQAKEGSQAADTIVALNIANMFARCIDPTRASWLVSKDTLPQIMTLTVSGNLIWSPVNAAFKEAPGGFLLGRPIRFSRHCAKLGDQGDVMFVDPTGYQLDVHSTGLKFDSSIHLYFDYAMRAYRWLFRIGGQPILSAPVVQAKGQPTESHFITLAARS